MTRVTVHVAKSTLSKLIARALAGEDVVICRGEREVVRLVPVAQSEPAPRQLGRLKGLVWHDPALTEPLSNDDLADWEEGPVFPGERS